MKLQLALTDKPETTMGLNTESMYFLHLPPFTEFTHPGLITTGMRLFLVCSDARLHGETLATDVTHVWPLSPMHSHVAYQV